MLASDVATKKEQEGAADLYIDLLKKCLTMWLWDAKDGSIAIPVENNAKSKVKQSIQRHLLGVTPRKPDSRAQRLDGRDWPSLAHSMIGTKRMDNLQFCVEDVLAKNVPGDLIETGVWRGGATIFMRGILRAYGVDDRIVWVADSFEGLPPPDSSKYPGDAGDSHHTFEDLAVSLENVKANFERYGLLDDQVRFLKGWFKDTLPNAPIERLAVMRLDGDMYESTWDGLTHLYPKLSVGGYAIIDDWGAVPACRKAVEDYRTQNNITEPVHTVDWTGVYWQRQK